MYICSIIIYRFRLTDFAEIIDASEKIEVPIIHTGSMKNLIKTLILCVAVCLMGKANAQLINCNPDPNGEPWWAGGLPEVTSEIQAELDAIPPLVISSKSSATILPSQVDNSQRPWFRPVFLQNGGCCGQASGVGYTFTYEVNRVRNVSGNLPKNQYPTHFTWNFLNKQDENEGSWRLNPERELPEQYWTDLVTEQPAGYVEDGNGDVHLYSAEALAWLISVTNGLNGQDANNFDGKTVTLEANVDMAAALWIPIADGTNLGTPNPDRLKFCGTFNGNGFVVNNLILFYNPNYENFESFFGNLYGARIENVVLRHVYSEGRNESDGKFFGSADPFETGSEMRQNVIDRCYVEIDEMHKDGANRESALFGFKNDGVITNCMVRCGKLTYPNHYCEPEGLFVWYNFGSIKNCASVADSLKWMSKYGGLAIENHGLIENCYSYIGDWFGDYACYWPPTPRMGVAEGNFGTIRHCYFNTFKYHDGPNDWFDDEPVTYNEGTIEWAVPFEPTPYFQFPYWIFADTVSIESHTGFVYKTLSLEEALDDWVLGQEHSEDYEYWCASANCNPFLDNYLPSFSGFDITKISENTVDNDQVILYPNPTNEKITIEGLESAEVQIYNAIGQLVKIVRNTNEICVKGLSEGVYLLRIRGKQDVFYTKRVMVVR